MIFDVFNSSLPSEYYDPPRYIHFTRENILAHDKVSLEKKVLTKIRMYSHPLIAAEAIS